MASLVTTTVAGTASITATTNDGAAAALNATQSGTGRGFQVARTVASATRAMADFVQLHASGGTSPAVHIQQTTTASDALRITSDGATAKFAVTGTGALTTAGTVTINQDANNYALSIDSESTSYAAISIQGAKYGMYVLQDLGGGYGAYFHRNLNEAGANALVTINSDHTASTQPALWVNQDGAGYGISLTQNGANTALNIVQQGASQGIAVDQNGNGNGLSIDSESTTHNTIASYGKYGMYHSCDVSNGYGLYIARNLNEAGSSALAHFVDDHTANTQTTVYIKHDGSGYGLDCVGAGRFAGSITPATDDSYNLGSDSYRFKNLYLRSDCIIGTDATVGGNLDVTGGLVVDGASTLGDGSDTTHVKGSLVVDTNIYGPSLGAVAVAAGLNVTGVGSFTGALTIGAYTLPNTDGTSGYHLQTNGSGAVTWQPGGGGTVTGSGTDNYIPRWNGTTALHNSIMYDSGASVGISSVAFTSPAGTLHTQAGGSNITYLDAYSTTNGTGSLLNFRKSDSATIGTKAQTDSGDSLGTMGFYGVHTGSDWGLGASINVSQEGVSGTAYVPAHIAFATCTSSAYGERMRITNDGNVGIGTTAPGSLFTISGNSDDGDGACALRIIDEDSTGGSKLPAMMFYGGSTLQGRIRGGDLTFAIAVGSTPTTALSINTGTQAATFSGSLTVEGTDTDIENLYVNQEAIFDGHAYPYADSSYTLGTSALRWSTIYGDAGNFSGALTGTSVDLTGDITMKSGYSTSSKIRFGLSSWGNNIGLESYWTVHSTNRNEGYIFKDTDDVELLRMHGSNNGTTPQRATFSGALTVSGTATSAFAGSVGIGTTNPSVGLEVAKTSADASFKVNRTDQTNIQLIAAGNSYVRASAALILQSNGANNRLTLATDGAATFSGTLTVNDNININKADGFIYLNSAGTGNSGCYVRGLSGGAMRFQSQFYYDWEVTGNFKMRLTADGKLGIGTTAPGTYTSVAANLEVKTSGHGGIAINAGAASLGMLAFVQNGTHKWSLECQNNATPYISFNEAGTQRLTIANGGKVGIGTTVPEGRVDVQMSMSGVDWTYGNWGEVWDSASNPGSKFNDCVFHIDTNRGGGVTGGIVGLAFSPGWQGHQNWGIYSTNESGGGYTQGDLRFVNQLNNATITERVTFKADGKVGIGTYSPATKLEVRSGDVRLTDAHVIEWGGTKARIGGSNSGDYLRFYTDDAVRICVISDGKVGINDTTPGYQLDVNGTFRVTGAATFDSAAYLNSTGTGIRGAYWTSTSTAVGSLYGNRIENMYTPNYLEKLLAYKVPTKFEVSNSSGSSFSDTTVTDAVAGIFNEGWYPANQYTWAQSSNKKIRFSFTTFGYRFVTCMAMRATTSSNTVTMMVEKSSSADFSSGVVTVFTSTGMNGWPGFWQIVNTWHNSGNSAAMRITLESNQANSTNITLNNIDCTGGYSFGSGGRILTGYSKTTGREGILHGRLGINASPSGYYLYVNGTSLFKDGVEMDDTLELDGNFTWSGYQYFTHSTARILANTADGSDTKVLYLGGGGDAGQGRGAYIGLHGNDTASTPGSLYLLSGNDGDVRMYSGGAERVTINNNGSIQYNGDTQQSWIQFKDAGTLSGYIGSGIGLAASPNNLNTDFAIRAKTKLALCTNDSNAAKVTILADGNVGIGNTAPKAKLHVGTSPLVASDISTTAVFADDVAGTAYPLTLSNTNVATVNDAVRMSFSFYNSWSATAFVEAKIDSTTTAYTSLVFGTYGPSGLQERMRVLGNGKVGIGTNAPDRLLHLYAGASGQATPTTSAMLVLEDDASGNYISFLNPNNATAGFFWGDPQDSARAQLIYSHADNKMTFNAGGAVHMTIQSDGNVGIGTNDPGELLQVKGNMTLRGATNLRYKIANDSNNNWAEIGNDGATAQNTLEFFTGSSATASMSILNNGNVGIGATVPGKKLEVVGEVRIADAGIPKLWFYDTSTAQLASIRHSSGTTRLGIFDDSNNERFTVITEGGASQGNVGIGTSTPAGLLTVRRNDAATGGQLVIEQDSTGDATLRWLLTSTQSWMAGIDNSDVDKFKISSDGTGVETATKLTIQVDGNVGIGTTAPSGLFHVYESSASEKNWYMENAGSGPGQLNIKGGSGRYMSLSRSGTVGAILVDGPFKIMNYSGGWNTSIYCKADGDVGIGDESPSYKLDVNGTFRVVGASVFGNISSNLYPSADSTYSLGDNTTRWSSIFADTIYGGGANITSLNASNLSSGTVASARLGTGTASSTTYLAGNGTWSTPSGGGGGDTVSITASADDILSVSSGAISGVDAGSSDKIVFWDNSQSKLTYLAASTGLYTNGTNLKVTATVAMSFPMGDASGTATPSSNQIECYGGGTITVSTNGGNQITWTDSSSSDYRLKSNISTFNSEAWTKVKSVNLRKFDFDESLLNPKRSTVADKVGFIAHELAEAGIEGAVEGTKDEVDSDGNPVYQKVCHAKLVPVMWGALKEAITKIETLETKVQTLENS